MKDITVGLETAAGPVDAVPHTFKRFIALESRQEIRLSQRCQSLGSAIKAVVWSLLGDEHTCTHTYSTHTRMKEDLQTQ